VNDTTLPLKELTGKGRRRAFPQVVNPEAIRGTRGEAKLMMDRDDPDVCDGSPRLWHPLVIK